MAAEQFSNNATTTLNGAITSGATSLVVTSATGFPTVPQFRLQIDSELLLVTAVLGTTFTVTRGVEDTTAAAHASGVAVTTVLTAGALGGSSDAAAATPSLHTLGTGATQACAGNDARLSGCIAPNGLALEYVSTTQINVQPGFAGDKSRSALLTLSADTILDVSTAASINGTDRTAVSGTVATTSGSLVVTGTGTSFLSAFTTRTGTGTYATSGTAVTGSGSKFLRELAVGDLVGDSTKGFSRVTAIASDTGATMAAALPNGNATAGSSFNIIENCIFQVDTGGVPFRVDKITSNTSLTAESGYTASTVSGKTGYVGGKYGVNAVNVFYHVWLVSGNSGTGLIASTQRTTPYGVSGYNISVRRIGSFIWTTSASIAAFSQWGQASERWYKFEFTEYSFGHRVLANGNATSWTAIVCSTIIPPTADNVRAVAEIFTPSVGCQLFWRRRNTGSTSVNRPSSVYANTSTQTLVEVEIPVDGAQCFDYVVSAASTSGVCFFDLTGYHETLRV